MNSRIRTHKRVVRFGAILVLMGFVAPMTLSGFGFERYLGRCMELCGLVALCYHAVMLWRERNDPYDLSKLWEEPAVTEVPGDDKRPYDLVYCHRCGGSLPANHSICPECGGILGGPG